MFDFHHWADWASQQAGVLRQQGMQASFTLDDRSLVSDNPAFFVDVDTDNTIGRIIVWANGDFDVSLHRDHSEKVLPAPDLPSEATDQNFRALFDRFVGLLKP